MTVILLWILVIYVTLVYAPIAAWLVELFPTRIRYTGMSLPYHIGNGWFGGFLPAIVFAIVAVDRQHLFRPLVSDRGGGDELRHRAVLPAGNEGPRHRALRQLIGSRFDVHLRTPPKAGFFFWRLRASAPFRASSSAAPGLSSATSSRAGSTGPGICTFPAATGGSRRASNRAGRRPGCTNGQPAFRASSIGKPHQRLAVSLAPCAPGRRRAARAEGHDLPSRPHADRASSARTRSARRPLRSRNDSARSCGACSRTRNAARA